MLRHFENAKALWLPVRTWVQIALVIIVLVHLGLRLYMVPQYRSELGGVEHNVIHGIQKLLLDIPLYQDPEQIPFDVMQYTPAYYALCAAIGKVSGIHGDDARAVFLISRIMALLLSVFSTVVVYRICRTAEAPNWASMLAAGSAFCTYTEHFYSRPDALQSFASLLAILFFIRWLSTPSERLLILTAAFAVLGLFAKQSGALVLALPFLFLGLQRNWRAVRTYVLTASTTIAIGLGITLIWTTPMSLWKNTVQGLANGHSWMMWQELFDPATYKYFVGWHLLGVLILVRGLRSTSPQLRFLALATPLAIAFGLLTGLKSGSRLNYLHEGLTLVFIGTAVLLGREDLRWKNGISWAFALYGLTFMAWRTKSTEHWASLDGPNSTRYAECQRDLAVKAVLVNELGLQPTDHVLLLYRDYLEHFLVGQSVLTQKDVIHYSTEPPFNYASFRKAMNDGTIKYVITDEPRRAFTILDDTYTSWAPIREVQGIRILARHPEQ